MKITMTSDHRYSPDGQRLVTLAEGETLDLDDAQAQRLVDRGVAKAAGGGVKKADAPTENKDAGEAPSNKASTKRSRSRKAAADA